MLRSDLRDVVHRRGLASAAGADLLRGADRPDAHTHAEAVGARLDEVQRLAPRHDVAAHHLEVRVRRLHPLNHLELVERIALGGVDDNDVDTFRLKRGDARAVGRPGPARRAADELLRHRVLRRVRVVAVLHEVRTRDEGNELASGVDDGQLALVTIIIIIIASK